MTKDGGRPARARLDPDREGAARHGIAAPRGQSAAGSRGGRFTRLFPYLPPCDVALGDLDALAERLRTHAGKSLPNTGSDGVPAGYTYLGQFVDHDITFDPTSKLQRDNDPHALVNFRTPRFDLDSLYGSGPADQPFLYDWTGDDPGVKLLVGSNAPDPSLAVVDLPRNAQGRALIADARNDENLIVSQLHLLFIQFHNKVVDCVRGAQPKLSTNELFDEAQRIVRWHYQWIVIYDLLPKIVGDEMARSVLGPLVARPGVTAPDVDRRIYRWRDRPAIPVEFSAAAYRFGHSMVRKDYVMNGEHIEGALILPPPDPPDADAKAPQHLGGFRWLPEDVKIEWPRFFGDGRPLPSMRIDQSLAEPLFALPPDRASLAALNLHRGRALGLPCGSDVALALGQEPLDEDELFPKTNPKKELSTPFWPKEVAPEARAAVLRSPPLWFYLLREAHARGDEGGHLGPIGGRIVAEVLVGLLEGDPQAFLRRRPMWTPKDEVKLLGLGTGHLGIPTMTDLAAFAAPPA